LGYTEDTEYASRNLIDLTMREEATLAALRSDLSTKEAEYRVRHWDFQTSDLNDDFSEAYVMDAFRRMARAHQAADELTNEVAALQASIGSHEVAVQAMCGALLQIVKQGLSLVHGHPTAAPDGRLLSGISLKEIVWEGRNQAIHYEDGTFNLRVTTLFRRLEIAYGPEFSLQNHRGQSRAKQIVTLLGWTSYQSFWNDMRLLGL
jgi:hypothetical protein